ncbi:MAG: metal-dependent hydrolase [Bacteroidetes bacterium]|nr:metal-dependent hydrolase [Bacteroidota bacterium]
MDSITQFALGAALGELVAGKKIGSKAILWGGIAGTIPDLDILFNPFFTELQKLSVHRGISHSLIFAFAVAPFMAWLMRKLYRKKPEITFRIWLDVFFIGIFTHPLLDAFTLYGTQLFLPFSDYRVALNSIAIVDPGYTLPLLIGTTFTLVLRRKHPNMAIKMNYLGLIIAHIYFLLTIANKFYVNQKFEAALDEQKIIPNDYLSNPVIFSNLLWCAVAKDDSMCYIGYYSILQDEPTIRFEGFKKNEYLLEKIKDKEGVAKLRWFSKNYFIVEEKNDSLAFYDVRYGKSNFSPNLDNEKTFLFYFKILDKDSNPLKIQQYISRKDMHFSEFMDQMKHRILHVD